MNGWATSNDSGDNEKWGKLVTSPNWGRRHIVVVILGFIYFYI